MFIEQKSEPTSQESRQEPPGAVRSRHGARSCQELTQKPPGAIGSRQEPPGAILEEDVWGALKIEHYVLPV